MGDNVVTIGGILAFLSAFGVLYMIYDARSKSKAAAAQKLSDDKKHIYDTIDKVERVLEGKIKEAHDRIDDHDDELKTLNRDLGRTESTAEKAFGLAAQK